MENELTKLLQQPIKMCNIKKKYCKFLLDDEEKSKCILISCIYNDVMEDTDDFKILSIK